MVVEFPRGLPVSPGMLSGEKKKQDVEAASSDEVPRGRV